MAPSEHKVHTCPDDAELRGYHARELSDDAADAIAEHLGTCAACAERAQRMKREHNAWIERIRSVGTAPSAAVERPAALDETPRPPEIPGYRDIEEVYRGGQGIVFRAWQESTKRQVALKVLREGIYASPAARRRFEREIELVAALSHRHIVTVFDSGKTADGHRYLVMDFVRGQALGRFVAERGLQDTEMLRLFATICDAVNYAHQRGVIHRDLKPGNILIDEGGEPHVLDFGLARPLGRRGATRLTTEAQVAGTLPYMSPEQARGSSDAVDVRSDVYALGVILYELLTGTYPYDVDGDTLEVLRNIAEVEPAPPGRERGAHRIDGELETIVLKSLAKDPGRRYQTAGELARDVRHYLNAEPIEAKRDSHWYIVRKTLARHRVGVAVTAAFAVLVLTSAIALGVLYVQQLRLRTAADEQARLARAAEQRAERRFDQVRQLARAAVFQFDEEIRYLPGSAKARKLLVETGLEYLDGLAAEAGNSIALQIDVAAGYVKIGEVQGEIDATTLGDLSGAAESYKKALAMLERVEQQAPDQATPKFLIPLTLVKLGDMQAHLGHDDEALESYRRALRRAQAVMEATPGDSEAIFNAGAAHERIGDMLKRAGKYEEALEHYEAMSQLSSSAASNGADLSTRRAAAVKYANMANVYHAQGEYDRALELYRQFLAVAEQLLIEHPDHIVPRADVGTGQQWIGIILADKGEHAAAIECYRASIEVFERLLADDPQSVVALQGLATDYSKLGEAWLALEDLQRAEDGFERAATYTEELVGRHPDRIEARRLLGVAYYKMAELARKRGGDDSLPATQRAAQLESARAWLEKTQTVFSDMQADGTLPAADAAVPLSLAIELKQVDAALAELRE